MPMPEPTTAELADLLAAVEEAIDLPYGATIGDEEVRGQIVLKRLVVVGIILRRVREGKALEGVAAETEYLRRETATYPAAGYVTSARLDELRATGMGWMAAVKAAQEELKCQS